MHVDGGNGQTADWWCADGVVTIQATWAHTTPAWQTGGIFKLPAGFAPPVLISAPFGKQNSAQSEGDSEMRVNPGGQVLWANLGGTQGTGLMTASITYHL